MDKEIILVCGEWIFDKGRWLFVVDKTRGSKVLDGNATPRFDEFVAVLYEEYGLEEAQYDIALSYMLPKKTLGKLPPEIPPVSVDSQRSFDVYSQKLRSHTIRLCVEIKEKERLKRDARVPFDDVRDAHDDDVRDSDGEFGDGKEQVGVDVSDDDLDERYDCCDDPDGVSSDDEDYSGYGEIKVNGDDEAKGGGKSKEPREQKLETLAKRAA